MNSNINTKHGKGEWEFDGDAAKNFSEIAEKNIPNYREVISKCLQITSKFYGDDLDIYIIDIGSATGNTLDVFINKGYKNVFGVDNSQQMIDNSMHKDRVINSTTLPVLEKPYDVVIANWTLHFVKERKEYIESIYKSMSPGGVFILTEKIKTTKEVHDLYHDFKRGKGLSDEEIKKKEQAIEGVLVSEQLSWYYDTLKNTGFTMVEIVDASWCFVTFLCRK